MRLMVLLLLPSIVCLSPLLPCHKECETRLSSDEEDFDVACNETCKIQKCREGCDLWINASSSSCHEVCEENKQGFNSKMGLYCVRGCSIAINLYMKAMKDEFGTPAQPYLVAETRTNSSITIRWVPSQYRNISYLVQWRKDGSHQTDWEYYDPIHLLKDNYLNVENLHPYTKYRFRVAWILLKNYPPLFSEESIVISTLPYGAPSTAPVITCLTVVSPSRVSLSFDPPPYPNGPILSYVLYIYEYPSGNIMIKDISDTSDGLHYMINGLKENTTYKVLLSIRNSMGEGPMDERNVTTLSKETSSEHHPPAFLIFGTERSVLKQGLRILDDAHVLYKVRNESAYITGIALNLQRNLFFVSDSTGNVYMVDLRGANRIKKIINSSPNLPTKLTFDWLNNKLYLAEEKQISRCDIKGINCEIALANMKHKAKDMHVDPLNGYLYFIASNGSLNGGLYRVDLVQFESGCVDFDKAQLIVNDNYLSAFAVDHKNFRLILPSSSNNTVVSIALDGNDVTDIRENSQTPQYRNVKSIAIHHDLLYWTTGNDLFGEEYHKMEDKYYQNVYFVGNGPFSALNVYHPDYQPYPVPLNPVESVESLFGSNTAKIKWISPRLLSGQGKGSWRKWSYEVSLTDTSRNEHVKALINDTIYAIKNLCPNTTYSVKVRAYSTRGKGPWSSEFRGMTLKKSEHSSPYILWGAQEGLLKSDFVGEGVELLVPKINLNNAHITDICWFDHSLFINTNTSYVYLYNKLDGLTRLQNITLASSIAIEWFAPKLYWSSPTQQMIFRSNIDGSQAEPVPILTMAKAIAIDSTNGYLYWATSHTVERSRLNGMDHFVYLKNALFSGKHVMGISLDFDKKNVYWMVRSYEGSIMYRACMVDTTNQCNPTEPEILGSLSLDGLHGPVSYFANRLFYFHESHKSFVSDVNGKNFAQMEGVGLEGLSSIEIIDNSLHAYPENYDRTSIKVVPTSVNGDYIHVNGTHDCFNITWQPDAIVNYGTVLYEIKVDDGDEVYTLITNDTIFTYPTMKRLPPYSLLTVTVQAFTYWASSKLTVATLYSPMSIPSQPIHPRVFITHKSSPLHGDQEIVADFRWSPPKDENGIISYYQINCWMVEDGEKMTACDSNLLVDGKFLQYQIKGLLPNTTYYFQVEAITEAGIGPPSVIVEAQASVERPVPQLLLAKSDSVKVADFDIHEEKLLYGKATQPAAIAYLAQERRVFWMEHDALRSSIDGTNASLIKHLSSEGTCMAVDWIGRQLFWAEVDKMKRNSQVFSVDLSYDSYPKMLFNSSAVISSLEVEPFSGSLIWTVASGNNCSVMISDMNGSNIRPFFARNYEYHATANRIKVKRTADLKKPCNCNPTSSVGQAITIDSANISQPNLIFIDDFLIWSSDMEGCYCEPILNATEKQNSGLPPTSITVDNSHIYWLNKTIGKVYRIKKSEQHLDTERHQYDELSQKNIKTEEIRGVRTIRAIGNHLQPYPDASCLISLTYKEAARLLNRTSHSLTLYLPPVHRPKICSKISSPSVMYTLFYGPSSNSSTRACFFTKNKNLCKTLSTYENIITIKDLLPFNNYSISVAVRNYYSERLSDLSPIVTYRTDEGVPSAPVNVTAKAMTPFKIEVTWEPPLFPNGYPISYGVQWKVFNSTKDSLLSIQPLCGLESNSDLRATIETSEAGKDHYISVRAYSSNCKMFNDSEEVVATTFQMPNNLTLLNATSTTLNILWISPDDDSISYHTLELTQKGIWIAHSNAASTEPSAFNIFAIENLSPKTKYVFRLMLIYKDSEEPFVWPQNFVSEFSTIGDVPSVPGIPLVKPIGKEVYQVTWDEALNNGYLDITYELEMKSDNEDAGWIFVTNSSINQWIVNNFSGNQYYEFRVRAVNEYGPGMFNYSEKSFFLPDAGALVDQVENSFGIIIAASIATVMLFIILTALYIFHMKKEKCKKILQEVTSSNQLVPDLELATLQDLPIHPNFIHQTNALYNLNDMLPSDEEFLSLPQIHKDQIVAMEFLGSGAFGEVYSGIVYGLSSEAPILKIAIKTLKKGATEHEKDEFIKEAKLMSNFKHEHILQLLGVCFDNNANFIILELMEGGDLLSYLRSNRPMIVQNSNLTLDDLLIISIDVAKGCKYLEDLHFVHRDLAARNCLVSSYDREHRIVKIGDFGLARDIYKNDYYRKEGEGLLPVRWMAPESLIDGIFTNQSDVWAFGVLLWEVMTLGQQPYPAQSNMEVLNYVREGNHLDKPKNCPDDMHDIMARCWSYNADDRPTFCYCLRALQEIRNKLIQTPSVLTAVYNYNYFNDTNLGTYIGRGIDAENDQNKFLDHNLDSRSTHSFPATLLDHETNPSSFRRSLSWTHTPFETERNQMSASFRNPSQIRRTANKYLEILGDNEDADGYQLPLTFQKTPPPNEPLPMAFYQTQCNPTYSSTIQLKNPSSTPDAVGDYEIPKDISNSTPDPRELVKKYPSFCNEMDRILHPDDSSDRSSTPSSMYSEDCCLATCDSWSDSTASTCPLELTPECHSSYDSVSFPPIPGITLESQDSSCC
ncbi:proto-oncogene tyrosine-protein kinase ROS isoform X2 [Parasteatoda tepidariorum]|nr:proto-oncogene tyrosine-protein kinase ROS isoform X2 [Parasteatoda tepidariorum]